jgi:hypothetical protein
MLTKHQKVQERERALRLFERPQPKIQNLDGFVSTQAAPSLFGKDSPML